MCSQQEVKSIISELYQGLQPLFPNSNMEAILFGSYARGEQDTDSDIDVMFLVDTPQQEISEKTWEIGDVAASILLDRGIVVSPIVENRSYFRKNADFLPFFRNIAREGVPYYA